MVLNIADKTYVSEPLFQAIRDRIISGEYAPGTLLSEKELTQEFSVSRTPYREALRKLETLKLVTVVPRFGTYVREVKINEVLDAYEVRMRLEIMAAELAAARRKESELDGLGRLLDKILAAGPDDLAAFGALDTRIHDSIYQCSGNDILNEIISSLRMICSRIWTSSLRRNYDMDRIKSQWEKIHSAIASRNSSDAGRHMEDHILYSIELIKTNIFS